MRASFFALCLTLLGATSNTGYALEGWMTWKENSAFTKVLLQTQVAGKTVFGLQPDRPIVYSECTASIYRPHRMAGPTLNPDNVLWCSFGYSENSLSDQKGLVVVPLAEVGIQAWGNQFDKYPFQMINNDFSEALYTAMKINYKALPSDSQNPQFNRMFVCGPDGILCTESYSISRAANGEGTASVFCHEDTESGVRYKTRCAFLQFD